MLEWVARSHGGQELLSTPDRKLFYSKLVLGMWRAWDGGKRKYMACCTEINVNQHSSESDVTYGQVWWTVLRNRALHLTHPRCTHTAVHTHTHTVTTHPEQWAARGAVGGSVPCSRVLRVERELYIHSPHLQFLPARDSNPQPLAYESDSLTIKPRLPQSTNISSLRFHNVATLYKKSY